MSYMVRRSCGEAQSTKATSQAVDSEPYANHMRLHSSGVRLRAASTRGFLIAPDTAHTPSVFSFSRRAAASGGARGPPEAPRAPRPAVRKRGPGSISLY